MLTPSLRLGLVVVLLAVFIVPGSAWAAGSPSRSSTATRVTEASPAALLSRVWRFFGNVWAKTGCYIDPNGRCGSGLAVQPPAVDVDTGCHIDPDGRCHS